MTTMSDSNTETSPNCASSPALKASGSSFYWALRLLPQERRNAMFHVYAFCREVDDIADEPGDPVVKMQLLEGWRRDVESLYGDGPPAQTVVCLKPIVERFGLDKADLLAVIDGMQTDAYDVVRMIDVAAFDLYLDRVACAVGRLSDKVFGLSGPASDRLAHHLGRALQITNILRDLDEDAERNRLYLPQSMLAEEGIESDDPQVVLHHPNLGAVLSQLAARAHEHYAQAGVALGELGRVKTRPARVMMAVYRRYLEKLEARGLSDIQTPVRVAKAEKLWLALRHGIL
ncbi:MAG: presqualene diphosphate synthase HpnD [Magnetovibrio sp.]|nr:presqualene diphosphate synthase HpnD [Magnetovibrio sp.]